MCCSVCDIWPQLSAWLSCREVPCLVLSVLCTPALQVWPTPVQERGVIKVISMIIQLKKFKGGYPFIPISCMVESFCTQEYFCQFNATIVIYKQYYQLVHDIILWKKGNMCWKNFSASLKTKTSRGTRTLFQLQNKIMWRPVSNM